jgi:glycine oxidase
MLRAQGLTVTLLERGAVGAQASGVAAGLLAPLGPLNGPGPLADLVLTAWRAFPTLVGELEQATGLHLAYRQSGALRVACRPERVRRLRRRWQQHWQPLGLQMQWLDGEQACQLEPLLTREVQAAVFAPEEARVDAQQVTQAFAQAARARGAHLLTFQDVCGFLTHKRRVLGVQTRRGETVHCGQVLLASGAWTAVCCSWLEVIVPITPLHGQLLLLPQFSQSLQTPVFGEGVYLVPRGDALLVGATREERGFDLTPDASGTAWLLEMAQRLAPRSAEVRPTAIWTGLRPHTPDAHPVFGFLPHWENVAVASGHQSLGVLLSGITGQIMARLLACGQLPALARPFSVARFLAPPDTPKLYS